MRRLPRGVLVTVDQAELDLRRLCNLYGAEYVIGMAGLFFEAHHRRSGEIIRADTAEILRQQIIEHQRTLWSSRRLGRANLLPISARLLSWT